MGLGTEISKTKASYVMEASSSQGQSANSRKEKKRGMECVFFMRNYLHNNEPTHPATVLLYLGRQNWCGPILSHQVQSLKAAALRLEFPMEAFF